MHWFFRGVKSDLNSKFVTGAELNCFVVWLIDERHLSLFPAGTIVRDRHHRESSTRHEQDMNLHRS